jgi:hypothetical protein
MEDLIEMRLLEAIRKLLTVQVNELLMSLQFSIPLIEFSDYQGGDVVVPVVSLISCESSEKERIIKLDAYTVTVTFSLPESDDSEFFIYTYSAMVSRALEGNLTIGGISERAVVTSKKYIEPITAKFGRNWQVVITLRITVEGMANVC